MSLVLLKISSCLNPLSQIITKSGYGYQFRNGTTVSHLLYMDDIKLYAKNERDIDSLPVERHSLSNVSWVFPGVSYRRDMP
ncbi:hypothetical protein D4764_13G0012700 [Takifugu flavidus]|uniref:Reverse transcriptase domain-containing protein n=1 Tax=Takifugu flavidus TaxID=433684 RepID=A0A5C6PDB2_9TELE|nr:hypothetical protein D4764_13G0012700 [Takifugu flavidus]